MVYPFSLSKSKLVLLHAVLHEYTSREPAISPFKNLLTDHLKRTGIMEPPITD